MKTKILNNLLILFLILNLSQFIFTETTEKTVVTSRVRGIVKMPGGTETVKILLTKGNLVYSGFSWSNGSFSIETSPGLYFLQVVSANYFYPTYRIAVSSRFNDRVKVKKLVQLQQHNLYKQHKQHIL
eukprot:TRINITY_DN418_c0_g2_i1.p1 TRINITY_DN418_c0_g2~~TRINITY_DN418_c0_g2_i1.p1  ORF type:complete len:128 (+),score=26.48 TRINITY_DN418_c0_g2_i1:213-596(+)